MGGKAAAQKKSNRPMDLFETTKMNVPESFGTNQRFGGAFSKSKDPFSKKKEKLLAGASPGFAIKDVSFCLKGTATSAPVAVPRALPPPPPRSGVHARPPWATPWTRHSCAGSMTSWASPGPSPACVPPLHPHNPSPYCLCGRQAIHPLFLGGTFYSREIRAPPNCRVRAVAVCCFVWHLHTPIPNDFQNILGCSCSWTRSASWGSSCSGWFPHCERHRTIQ